MFKLAACAAATLSLLGAPPPASAAAEAASAYIPPPIYTLGPGDQLSLIVLDEPQFTAIFTIAADGTLSLPWLGEVPANGRTVGQLRADIEARLKAGYIVNPGVSLQVTTCRPFFVLGEVNKPGQYPFVFGLSARAAIATAGGFSYRAKMSQIYVRHAGEEKEWTMPVTPASKIYPGDTIRVAESWF